MALDVLLGAKVEDRVEQRERQRGRQAPVRGVVEAIAEEEHAVGLDEHHARVGRMVAADVPHPDADVAELDVQPIPKDDVGRRDVDLAWGGQLLLDVRGVVPR